MGLDNPLHLAFIVVLFLLVFGAKRLPEMGRSLGAGMRGFRDAISGDTSSSPRLSEPSAPREPAGGVPAVQQAEEEGLASSRRADPA